MPIPFILGGLAIVAGGLGVVGHSVAKDNNEEAQRIIRIANNGYDESLDLLEAAKLKTTKILAEYGEFKLNVCSGSIKQYIDITNQIPDKNKVLTQIGNYQKHEISNKDLLSKKNFIELESSSAKSEEIIAQGVATIGTGALMSVGTYGGVSMLATASTGTAISSLSGAAATNATMAWLGGGSLATGGLGIAGGTAMLGGIAIGPAILISSIFASIKSDENLEKARSFRSEVNVKIAEIERVVANLEAIELRAQEGEKVLSTFNNGLVSKLKEYREIVDRLVKINRKSSITKVYYDMEDVIKNKNGINNNITNDEKNIIIITEVLVKKIYEVLNTPLLNEEGSFTEEFELLISDENINHVMNIMI